MYIFLDVDGVLNTADEWKRKVYSINPACIAAFLKLLRSLPHPKIVLSSSWRNGIANDGTTAVHINDLISALKPARISTMEKTRMAPDGSRSREINHYLKRHPQTDILFSMMIRICLSRKIKHLICI